MNRRICITNLILGFVFAEFLQIDGGLLARERIQIANGHGGKLLFVVVVILVFLILKNA